MRSDEFTKPEEISKVWSINITKMHFQQNACFQIRNWALGITGIVIPLIWVGNVAVNTKIYIHIFTILLMIIILHRDLSWQAYQFMYRERARLCERILLGRKQPGENLSGNYFEYQPVSVYKLLRNALSPITLLLFKTDYIELYLIGFLFLSLLVTVILG